MGAKSDSDLNPIFRSMILRAVGIMSDVEIDATPFDVRKDDVVLVCSDGLSKMVPDRKIASIVGGARGSMPRAVDALIAAAYEAGASDNVTVEAIRVSELPPPMKATPMPRRAAEGDEPDTGETYNGEALSFASDACGDCTVGTVGSLAFASGEPDRTETFAEESAQPPGGVCAGAARRFQIPAGWLAGLATGVAAAVLAGAVVGIARGCGGGRPEVDRAGRQAVEPDLSGSSTPVVAQNTPVEGEAGRRDIKMPSHAPPPAKKTPPPDDSKVPKTVDNATDGAVLKASSQASAKPSSPEEREREELAARLKAARERMRMSEATAADAAEQVHAAAVALGEACRDGASFMVFAKRLEALGVKCAVIRANADRLAAMKPDDNGVDAVACVLVREIQKSVKAVEASGTDVTSLFPGVNLENFARLDLTTSAAFVCATELIRSAAKKKGRNG